MNAKRPSFFLRVVVETSSRRIQVLRWWLQFYTFRRRGQRGTYALRQAACDKLALDATVDLATYATDANVCSRQMVLNLRAWSSLMQLLHPGSPTWFDSSITDTLRWPRLRDQICTSIWSRLLDCCAQKVFCFFSFYQFFSPRDNMLIWSFSASRFIKCCFHVSSSNY